MTLHFLPATLSHWDAALAKRSSEASRSDSSSSAGDLVLSFFDNERPLCGAAGMADWRLYGQLSRLITRGHCHGRKSESLMMPAGLRLPFERIFLFGLGKGDRMNDAAFSAHASGMRDVLRRAGSTRYSVQPPGRATGLIAARRAAELWMQDVGAEEMVTLIDTNDAYKEMSDLLVTSS